jgi:hypothetical protein
MALARIISHSHEYCRELAVDLLARGYAVEIVSPDKIPDNFADLELRVDADTANDLTAKVAAHSGEHSSFLDFVHHLSAPMGDFVRRPPRTKFESIAHLSSVNFNAEPSLAAEVEIPAPDQSPKIPVLPVVEIPVVESPKLTAPPNVEAPIPTPSPASTNRANSPLPAEEGPPLLAAVEEVPAKPIHQRPKRGITIIVHRSRPEQKTGKPAMQSGGWLLRVAAGFALVVALSAIPIVGIRGGDPLVPSAAADSQKFVPGEANSHGTSEPRSETAAAGNNPQPHIGSQAPSQPAVSSKESSQQGTRAETSGKIKDLAPEAALVYRDKPAPKTGSHARHDKTRHRHQDDTVAQDTVTYLDRGFASKNH